MKRYRLWLLILLPLAGCVPASYMGTLFARDMVEPVYELADRPTLVMVDDPRQLLRSAVVANTVADRIMHELKTNEIITQFVPLTELQALAASLGDDYQTTPIDLIGRRLGAQQVLYVRVEALQLVAEPSMLQPRAAVGVKIIDVENSVRVFPPSGAQPQSHNVRIEMSPRYGDNADPGEAAMLMQEVADEIGTNVARLFYEYEREKPGHTLPD